MNEKDDVIFRDALLAMEVDANSDVDVPQHFAQRTVAAVRKHERGNKRRRMMAFALAAALASVVCGWAFQGRSIAGQLISNDGGGEFHLGARAVAVLAPRSSGTFAVGGLFSARDVVRLERGSVFLRVESGRSFVVETAYGRVEVIGTCLEVTLMERDMTENTRVRSQWFGAGALATGMLVTVYQGTVRVSHTQADESAGTVVHAGNTVMLGADGMVRYGDGSAQTPGSRVAPSSDHGTRAVVPDTQSSVWLTEENRRLAALLQHNGISPVNGQPLPNAPRGLRDEGNTDLSPEEWATLADRGELRFRLPTALTDDGRMASGLTDANAHEVEETIDREYSGLRATIDQVYHDATGQSAEGRSLESMKAEIEDLTESDEASHVRWTLAQERAGRAVATSARPAPYERMLRAAVSYETTLEAQIASIIGAENAHELVHGERYLSAHAYGMSGRPRAALSP